MVYIPIPIYYIYTPATCIVVYIMGINILDVYIFYPLYTPSKVRIIIIQQLNNKLLIKINWIY